eukprot:967582_1
MEAGEVSVVTPVVENQKDEEGTVFSPTLLCIHAIIEDTIDKLNIVQNLRPPKELASDESLTDAITDKKRLESTYKRLMAQREDLRTQGKQRRHDNSRKRLNSVLDEFRGASVRLQKKMDENRTKTDLSSLHASALTAKLRQEKAELMLNLDTVLKEISSVGSVPSLADYLEDSKHQSELFQDTSARVDALATSIANLEKRTQDAETDFAQTADEMKKNVVDLKAQLEEAKKELSVNQVIKVKESEACLNTQRRLYESQEEQLKKDLAQIRVDLVREIKAYDYSLQFLKSKTEKLTTHEEIWQKRSDSEIPKTDVFWCRPSPASVACLYFVICNASDVFRPSSST